MPHLGAFVPSNYFAFIYVHVYRPKDVPPGQAAAFTIEGQKIALFNVEGTYYANRRHLHAPWRTVVGRRRSKAPGSPVRGTVRISTSKPALFWGRQRRRAFQVVEGDDIKVEV